METPRDPDAPNASGSTASGNTGARQSIGDVPGHTEISDIGEFGLIGLMRETLGEPDDDALVEGIADDAAVYRTGSGRVHVVTSDILFEGVHFDRSFMPLEHLGFKAMSANVSDVVAMNAQPRYATVSLGIPKNMSVEMVQSVYEGIREACGAYDCTVVGGDTSGSQALTIGITLIGEADEDDIVYRRGAQVGDKICVTGDVGASYAGLKVLVAQRNRLQEQQDSFEPELDRFSYVIRRHLAPPAQLKAVRDWAEAGVQPHSLIDVSDGVASEVHHVCEASGVGAQLFEPALPISVETRNTATEFGDDVSIYALFGGEDYELLFTLPEDKVDALDPQTFSVIGEVIERDANDHPVTFQRADGETVALQPGGFDHFDDDEADADA